MLKVLERRCTRPVQFPGNPFELLLDVILGQAAGVAQHLVADADHVGGGESALAATALCKCLFQKLSQLARKSQHP